MNVSHYYVAFRFRTTDSVHRSTEIQYSGNQTVYIGQTKGCEVMLESLVDYVDACYAVIITRGDGRCYIVRKEDTALIRVDGSDLGIVAEITTGTVLQFDTTEIIFSIHEGDTPTVTHVYKKSPKTLWAALACVVIVLAGLVIKSYNDEKSLYDKFDTEMASVYRIETDSLFLVCTSGNIVGSCAMEHHEIGTGFVTRDGYFVTARHCVEPWLAMEGELRNDIDSITSIPLQWAIRAEIDTTVNLVAGMSVKDGDGKEVMRLHSYDFAIDNTHDNILEFGGYDKAFIWRSVVSCYENHSAELGDAAVTKVNMIGNIKIAGQNEMASCKMDEKTYCIGFPPMDYGAMQKIIKDSRIFQYTSAQEWFLIDEGLDKGFSGGPVFIESSMAQHNVIGIVCRSNGKHTLVVPSARINALITQLKSTKK